MLAAAIIFYQNCTMNSIRFPRKSISILFLEIRLNNLFSFIVKQQQKNSLNYGKFIPYHKSRRAQRDLMRTRKNIF